MSTEKIPTVRIYEPTTLEELDKGLPLLKLSYTPFFSFQLSLQDYRFEIEKALREPHFFIFFASPVENSDVVGVTMFRKINFIFIGEGIWVHNLVVAENYRNKGVGRQLFSAIQSKGRELGVNTLYFNGPLPEVGETYSGAEEFIIRTGSSNIGKFWQNKF